MSPPVQLHRHPVDEVECYFLWPILIPNPKSPNPESQKIWQKNAVNRLRDPRDSTEDRPDLAQLNRHVWHFKRNQEIQLIVPHGIIPAQWKTVLGIIVQLNLIPAERWILYTFIAVLLPASMAVIRNTFLRITSWFQLLKDHHYLCICLATCFPEIQITKESPPSGRPNCKLL